MMQMQAQQITIDQVLTFKINDVFFCIPVDMVESVIEMPDITELPQAPVYIAGSFLHRNQTALAIKLRHLLGMPESDKVRRPTMVVISLDNKPLGLWIDEIKGLVDTDKCIYSELPSLAINQGVRQALIYDEQVIYPVNITAMSRLRKELDHLDTLAREKAEEAGAKAEQLAEEALLTKQGNAAEVPDAEAGGLSIVGDTPVTEMPGEDIEALTETVIPDEEAIPEPANDAAEGINTESPEMDQTLEVIEPETNWEEGPEEAILVGPVLEALAESDTLPVEEIDNLTPVIDTEQDTLEPLLEEAELVQADTSPPISQIELIDELMADFEAEYPIQDEPLQTTVDLEEETTGAVAEAEPDITELDNEVEAQGLAAELEAETYNEVPGAESFKEAFTEQDPVEAGTIKTDLLEDINNISADAGFDFTETENELAEEAGIAELGVADSAAGSEAALLETDSEINDLYDTDQQQTTDSELEISDLQQDIEIPSEDETLTTSAIEEADAWSEIDEEDEWGKVDTSDLLDDADERSVEDEQAIVDPTSDVDKWAAIDDTDGETALDDTPAGEEAWWQDIYHAGSETPVGEIEDDQQERSEFSQTEQQATTHDHDVLTGQFPDPYAGQTTLGEMLYPVDDYEDELTASQKPSFEVENLNGVELDESSDETPGLTEDDSGDDYSNHLQTEEVSLEEAISAEVIPEEVILEEVISEEAESELIADDVDRDDLTNEVSDVSVDEQESPINVNKDNFLSNLPAVIEPELPDNTSFRSNAPLSPLSPEDQSLAEVIQFKSKQDELKEAEVIGDPIPYVDVRSIISHAPRSDEKNTFRKILVSILAVLIGTIVVWRQVDWSVKMKFVKQLPPELQTGVEGIISYRMTITKPVEGPDRLILDLPDHEIRVIHGDKVDPILLKQRQDQNAKIYKVKKGDTLWAIAEKHLENPYSYPQLAKNNAIKKPDLIFPGDIVTINRKIRD